MVRLPRLGVWLLVLSLLLNAVSGFLPRTAEGTHCPTAAVQSKSIDRIERTLLGNTIVTKVIRAVTAEDEEFRQCRCAEAESESESMDADGAGCFTLGLLSLAWTLPHPRVHSSWLAFAGVADALHPQTASVAIPPPNA